MGSQRDLGVDGEFQGKVLLLGLDIKFRPGQRVTVVGETLDKSGASYASRIAI